MSWWNSVNISRSVKATWGLKNRLQVVAVGFVLLTGLIVFIIGSSGECQIPAIYNFGDSNSDTGCVSAAFRRVLYPNGIAFFGKPSGRYCDERVIIDFVDNVINRLPRLKDFSKALYTFDIRQNDIHHALATMTEDEVRKLIPELINQFALAVKKLHQLEARTFWIPNAGLIGCLPYLLLKYPPEPGNIDEAGWIKSYNEVAKEFNRRPQEICYRAAHPKSRTQHYF
ncbi:hypothetical protein RDABS01_022420 [Bienertia sinuspersici]